MFREKKSVIQTAISSIDLLDQISLFCRKKVGLRGVYDKDMPHDIIYTSLERTSLKHKEIPDYFTSL